MLGFEDELRKKDLIFPFVHQEPAHCAVCWKSICVRRYESKFKQAMIGQETGEKAEQQQLSHGAWARSYRTLAVL